MIKHCSVLTILAGVGACAFVAFAPIAGADDPPCEQQPPDQQQQCQQDQGAGIANQVVGQVQDGLKQGQDAVQRGPVKPLIDPATGKMNPGPHGNRALVNGVDTCMPYLTPLPPGTDVQVAPGDTTGICILAG